MRGRAYREAELSRLRGGTVHRRCRRLSATAAVGTVAAAPRVPAWRSRAGSRPRSRRAVCWTGVRVGAGGDPPALGLVFVLVAEGEVDADEGLLLLLGQMGVGEDLAGQVGVAVGLSRIPAWT